LITITIRITANNQSLSPLSLLRKIFYPLYFSLYRDMVYLNNDKKKNNNNDNHTIPAATIFILTAIIMTASTISAPAAATTASTSMPQPVTVATDNQSVNVVISWEPVQILPGEETQFTLDFQDPSSGESISHVNYNFEVIDQNGGTVESMTDLHTHSGSDEQAVTFDAEGSFNLITSIIGTGIDPPFDTTQSGTAQTVIPVGQQLAGGTGGNDTSGTTAGGGGTTGGNATAAGGVNQTISEEVVLHLEEVRIALEDDDTDTALMHLDLALNALGANTTTTTGGVTNATAADGGGGMTAEDEEDGEEEGEGEG
jgi:hypothetical protein